MATKIKTLSVVSVLSLMVGLSPMSASAEKVSDAVAQALQNHPSIEAARARIDASVEDENEQYSSYFPELNVGAKGGRIFGDNSTTRGLVVTRGQAYSYYGEGSVSLRQPLLGLWQTSYKVGAAEARAKSADQAAMDVREKLALMTAKAYIELLRNGEAKELIEKRLKEMKSLEGRISEAVKDGGLEETDQQRAQDLLLALKRTETSVNLGLQNAAAQYIEYVGMAPPTELFRPAVAINMAPESAEEAITYALENNAAYRASKLDVDAARDDLSAEQWELAPDLDGELSYLRSDQEDAIGGETTDARAIVRLNWDFSTGGAQFARINKKRHEHKEALANAEEYKKQLERMVRIAYANYGAQLDMQGFTRQREVLSQKVFKNSQVQFDGARISLLDLLRAHNERTAVQLEGITSKYEVISAQFDLLASLGLLRESLGLADGQVVETVQHAVTKADHDQGQ